MVVFNMRLTGQIALFLAVFCSQTIKGQAQTLIAGWDFEALAIPSEGGGGTTYSGIVASAGTQVGIATLGGVHANSQTRWSNPSGNGSNKSFAATRWQVNDYFQFSVSTLGFNGLSVAWDQLSEDQSSTAFQLRYSLDGTNFTTFASYAVNTTATLVDGGTGGWWSASSPATNTSYSYDLSGVSSLNDQSSVIFRLVAANANTNTRLTTGTAIDNVTVTGVPEPSSASLLAAGIGGLMVLKRRRKS